MLVFEYSGGMARVAPAILLNPTMKATLHRLVRSQELRQKSAAEDQAKVNRAEEE